MIPVPRAFGFGSCRTEVQRLRQGQLISIDGRLDEEAWAEAVAASDCKFNQSSRVLAAAEYDKSEDSVVLISEVICQELGRSLYQSPVNVQEAALEDKVE